MSGDPIATPVGKTTETLPPRPANRRVTIRRALVVTALLGAGIYAVRHGEVPDSFHPDRLRSLIAAYGAWGPLIYSAFKILSMVFILPLAPIAVVAGVLYGFAWGSVLNLATTVLGAAITFAIGRRLGREAIQKRLGGRMQGFDRGLSQNGLAYIALSRLAPVLPFNVVSYLAAVSSISWRDFVLGTAVGNIPTAMIFSYVGAAAGEASLSKMLLALSLLGVLILIPVIIRQRRRSARR